MSHRNAPADRRPWGRLAGGLLLGALLLLAAPAAAEDPAGEETTPVLATGTADLVLPGRPPASVAYSLAPDGPRFALAPIAAALAVELRIGPKGESHTLVFADGQVIVGPDRALMVTVAAAGEGAEEVTTLPQLPILDAAGLKVSLDFLDRSFGTRLSYQFEWRPRELDLVLTRRRPRRLTGATNVVHQHGLSIVEVRFSDEPRYRVERLPGALEIRFLGDRVDFTPDRLAAARSPDDRLVTAVVHLEDRVRIELAGDATAAEPRLLLSPVVSLIVEVYRHRGEASPGRPDPSGGPPPRLPRTSRPPARPGVRTIVLDPGHGGEETGAVGASGATEAELTLRVGRALERQLERRLPVRVVLTRNEDVDLPLDSRAAIANEHRADLFISLHFNSSFGTWAHGAETYFLSREASDQLAAEVAATENLSNGGTADRDPELGLQLILWDLAQSFHLAESQRFANLVQEELNLALGLRNRGVKQAPFRVLMGAQMPAVLVELGFLSNPEEEAKLRTPAYLSRLVDALVQAVVRFKNQLEARQAAPPDAPPTRAPGAPQPGAPGR